MEMIIMSKRKIITVSFKNNDQDNELYEKICKSSDKSAFIKDNLREHFKNNKPKGKLNKIKF